MAEEHVGAGAVSPRVGFETPARLSECVKQFALRLSFKCNGLGGGFVFAFLLERVDGERGAAALALGRALGLEMGEHAVVVAHPGVGIVAGIAGGYRGSHASTLRGR